jgi:hypothetical protein
MANTVISLRSSDATGNTPSLGVLANGELSLNFADGILYYKTAANALGSIRTTQVAGLNKEIQFNDAGSFGSDDSLTFDKANTTLTTNNFVANTITTGSGVEVISFANQAFNQANSANVLAQAAFDKANTDVTFISAPSGTYGSATLTPIVTVAANGRITDISTIATSGSDGSSGDYFPTNNDWGYYDDTLYSAFGESLLTLYDCRIDPITPSGYLLTKDFGFLT